MEKQQTMVGQVATFHEGDRVKVRGWSARSIGVVVEMVPGIGGTKVVVEYRGYRTTHNPIGLEGCDAKH